MAQFNNLSLADTYGRGLQEKQSEEFNALRMNAAEQQLGEQERIGNTRWMLQVSEMARSVPPEQLPQFVSEVEAEGARRGVWQALPQGVAQSGPENILNGFQTMGERARIGLAGIQEETPETVKDAAGYRRFLSGPNAGNRVFPDVVAPQGSGQPSRQQWEYEQHVKDETAAGREPPTYMQWLENDPRRQSAARLQAYHQYLRDHQSSGSTEPPMSEQQYAEVSARGISGSRATGAGISERQQEMIDVGLRQADAAVILRRGIQLLDMVETGRPQSWALAARNMFGIAGADETELNANLGKAVLSQLRQTFGAQFTQQEGERLEYIEANFGKSTEGNKRLLQQALVIAERAARRGLEAAESAEDTFTVNEIRNTLEFNLSDPGDGNLPVVRSDADYAKLASGTRFVDENGQEYTKP